MSKDTVKDKRRIKINAHADVRKTGVLITFLDKTDFKGKPGDIERVTYSVDKTLGKCLSGTTH